MLSRLFPLAALIAAVLATFRVSFEYWTLILVVLGLPPWCWLISCRFGNQGSVNCSGRRLPNNREQPWCDPRD